MLILKSMKKKRNGAIGKIPKLDKEKYAIPVGIFRQKKFKLLLSGS